jgi:hypothetical protein
MSPLTRLIEARIRELTSVRMNTEQQISILETQLSNQRAIHRSATDEVDELTTELAARELADSAQEGAIKRKAHPARRRNR